MNNGYWLATLLAATLVLIFGMAWGGSLREASLQKDCEVSKQFRIQTNVYKCIKTTEPK